jgi:cytoskeletal protein RodZ
MDGLYHNNHDNDKTSATVSSSLWRANQQQHHHHYRQHRSSRTTIINRLQQIFIIKKRNVGMTTILPSKRGQRRRNVDRNSLMIRIGIIGMFTLLLLVVVVVVIVIFVTHDDYFTHRYQSSIRTSITTRLHNIKETIIITPTIKSVLNGNRRNHMKHKNRTSLSSSSSSSSSSDNNTIITPYYIPSLRIVSNDNDTPATEIQEDIIQQYIQTSSSWPLGDTGRRGTSQAHEQHDDDTPSPPRVLHIIKTRLMQEQSTLYELNKARLLLFRIFCVPTIAQQTIQNFIWIIKIDPELHNTNILYELIIYIQETMIYNNTYIIGSNTNFRINEKFPGAWRNGAEVYEIMNCKVYTGNQHRLQLAMSLYDANLPILETRLDADDGLHIQYIQTVQDKALTTFHLHPHVQWVYYCCRRHMEWHWIDPLQFSNSNSKNHYEREDKEDNVGEVSSTSLRNMLIQYGTIQGVTHTNLCITPGITTAYNSYTKEHMVPVFAHDELVKKIKLQSTSSSSKSSSIENHTNHNNNTIQCGYTNTSYCLQFVETFLFEAIRSRCPTSAGMLQIQTNMNSIHTQNTNTFYIHYMFWNMLYQSFTISRQHIRYIQEYITEHLIPIANDNLVGQCTTGHSCKESAKHELQLLIQSRISQQSKRGGKINL